MALFSWGANSHGQLALGYESELCMSPQLVPRLLFNVGFGKIQSIVGGGGHTLVLNESGQLFSCGWNNRGQLGLNTIGDKNQFERIPSSFFDNSPVENIACGWDSSAAITVEKKLFVWGSNTFQQLGICKRGFSYVTKPLRISLPKDEEPVKVTFGLHHCCVLTNTNTIYIFGRLKIRDENENAVRKAILHNEIDIVRVQPTFPVKMMESGQNHALLSDGHRILALGDNKFGQANSFDFDETILKICCGWTHNGILTKSGKVFLWGRNKYGQVGGSSDEVCRIPKQLEIPETESIKSLHLGSEHGLIITNSNRVFTWGWNEHGNCGNGNTDNVYNPCEVRLPSDAVIAGAGAGFNYVSCA